MKGLSLFVALVLCSGSLAFSAALQPVTIGSRVVSLSSPPDYVDLCGADKDAAKLLPSFIPKENALLGCYTTPADLLEWKNNQGGTFRSYLIATVMKNTIKRDVSLNDLRSLRSQTVASLDTLYEKLEPNIRRQVDKASTTVSNELGIAVATKIESLVPVGMFDTSETSFSTVWIAKLKHKAGSTVVSNTQVQISSIVLVNGKALVLFTYGRFDGPQDVERYKAVARAWITQVQNDSKVYEIPRTVQSTFWSEDASFSFLVENTSTENLAAEIDKVLLPRGFKRTPTESMTTLRPRGGSLQYRSDTESAVSIADFGTGCLVVRVFNYDSSKKGSAPVMATSIGTALVSARGVKARLFILNTLCKDTP